MTGVNPGRAKKLDEVSLDAAAVMKRSCRY
jgi:hypothetical protein